MTRCRSRHRRWPRVLTLGAVAASWTCSRPPVDAGRVMAAHARGAAYLQEGRLPEAEAQFREVIAAAPWVPAGYANLGLVYLRSGRYREAEVQIRRALRRDSTSPDIRLLRAALHDLTGRSALAEEELEGLLSEDPANLKALYAMARLASRSPDSATRSRREDYLSRIVVVDPANLAARLQLAQALAGRGVADSAVRHLEELRRVQPDPPREARGFLDQAVRLLRASRADEARAPLERFEQFMEVSIPYQASLRAIQAPQGPQAGVPALTFPPIYGDPSQTSLMRGAISFRLAMPFPDLEDGPPPATAGPEPAEVVLAVADYDADGMEDLLVSGWSLRNRSPTGYLLQSDSGRFVEASGRAGLALEGELRAAAFADYDNDGRVDLYLAAEGGSRLYRGIDGAVFREVKVAGLATESTVRKALFVDLDHDGDLDLFLATSSGNRVYRNNLDGSFREMARELGLTGGPARDVALGDFNGDGLVDLVVVTEDTGVALYRNLGQQRFRNLAAESGLAGGYRAAAVAVGDYDNDGFLDLVLTLLEGGPLLYRNTGEGTFMRDQRSDAVFRTAGAETGLAVTFLDYDNDGFLDLALVGEPRDPSARGGFLFRNDGEGRYTDRSDLLPADLGGGRAVSAPDLDGDGDQDLVIAGAPAGLRVLRNDGGNANRYVQLRLRALGTGSGKNNTFGIGARVELRAGDLYQMRVVTGQVTHFGLGSRPGADVLRVEWPNGVPQVLARGSSAVAVEEQILKGSCPFLYAWDGTTYRFVTDMMWRSALGMPLGIMGGDAAYAPAGASREYLRFPGSLLQPRDGRYILKITEELWETAYVDEVKLVVVDHPDSVDVYVDERFVPPGPTPLRLYQISRAVPPVAATDQDGTDLLPQVLAQDDRYVANLTPARYQGLTESHDLILDLGNRVPGDRILLFLNGWIFPTDASINVALGQSAALRARPPSLDVRDPTGRWRTAIPDLGFPAGKNKTVVADLSGLFPTADRRVRIRTTMQIYWDRVFVAAAILESPVRITSLEPVAADLRYRGFSRMHRKGGPDGPHWFDYEDVSPEPRWRPIEGRFTRFGDVRPLLRDEDDMYVVMAPGDEMTIEFDAGGLPPLPARWTRDFLIYSSGWIKDADKNTAHGATVDPLPFHAMTRYPYGAEKSPLTNESHRRFLDDYFTRVVTRARPSTRR